jgi:hypothetical protein
MSGSVSVHEGVRELYGAMQGEGVLNVFQRYQL